jgi:hypothetical protein
MKSPFALSYINGSEGGFSERLPLQPTPAEIVDLKKLFDPVFPTFPADAGSLHSVNWREFGENNLDIEYSIDVFEYSM